MDHLIIDGYNVAYQSHFAFQNFQTNTGVLSGSVYGFLVGVRSVKTRFPYCHVTIAWDNEATRRKAIFAGYKADRSSSGIGVQIADLKGFFRHMNVSQTEYPGEEADDVIATLTKKYKEEGQVIVYSADKDMLQLVEDGKVTMIRPKSGNRLERVFDEEEVKKEYGVGPKDLHAYFCFRGDKVDSIPGVPRLKSSRIAYLVNKYKNNMEIYANLKEEKLTNFERVSLSLFESQIQINQELVRLRDDLELIMVHGIPDAESLQLYLDKYEIRSINPHTYLGAFKDSSSFNTRKAPALVEYSLFDE
jgi:DNA polymerase-1